MTPILHCNWMAQSHTYTHTLTVAMHRSRVPCDVSCSDWRITELGCLLGRREKHQWMREGIILAGIYSIQVTANDCYLQHLQLDVAEPLAWPLNILCIECAIRSDLESMLLYCLIRWNTTLICWNCCFSHVTVANCLRNMKRNTKKSHAMLWQQQLYKTKCSYLFIYLFSCCNSSPTGIHA